MSENNKNYSNKKNSYYLDKKIEERKKAKCYVKIWEDSDSEDETPEQIFKNFFKSNNYLDDLIYREKNNMENEKIKDLTLSEVDSYNSEDEILIKQNEFLIKNELLGKKIIHPDLRLILNEEDIGPKPLNKIEFEKDKEKKFYSGTTIDKTEAQLYAQYVQKGERIPRRGEIGLSSDAIEKFEQLGYVMSGSRHKKMTLARMKKEQQVYTAEEKRALAIYNLEQQQTRERNIINEMHYMWKNQPQYKDEDS